MNTFNLDTTLLDFESFLLSHSPQAQSFHPHFQQAVWEMLRCGGKRFRPALMLCVVGSYEAEKLKKAFLPALAMEVVHTFSLIHDDLPSIDNAPLRRGNPTLHTRYGEVTAILSGDFLNAYAFYLLSCSQFSPSIQMRLIQSLSKGTCQMIIGEALDCAFEHQSLEIDKLLTIHTLKTAHLIATALQMGAIMVEMQAEEEKKLWDFGIKLGVFFQIRDDLIDALQNPQEAGKPTQSDGNKNNYVNLLGLQGARWECARYVQELKEILKEIKNPILQNSFQSLLGKYFQAL